MVEFPDNGFAPHGTRVARVAIVAAPSAGKTTFATALVPFMCKDRKRIRCIGPVPKLAATLGLPFYDLPTNDADAQERFFRKEYEEARKLYPEGERLEVVDEADQYFSVTGRVYGCPALREICNVGRNFYISQIYIARGPLDLSRNTRGLFNVMFIGQAAEPRTAEWWEDFTRIPDFGRTLADFPPYKFIMYRTVGQPHVLGVAWAEGGKIQVKPWEPTEPEDPEDTETETPDESETSEPSEEVNGDDIAYSPDAVSASPTGTSGDTATGTGRTDSARTIASGRPGSG